MSTKAKHIFSKIQRFFDFSKGERRGILILLIILFLLLLFQIFYSYFYLPQKKYTFSNDIEEKINHFYARQEFIKDSLSNHKSDIFKFNKENSSTKTLSLNPFPFNPNNLPRKTWKALGLTDKQINTIKNFEAKGGKFYVKEDLRKIYSISENEYKQLEPFINIPDNENKQKKYTEKAVSNSSNLLIELNTTDSLDLQKIPGIGVMLSRRIIRYRNALGGYISKQQLLEVYGFDTNSYQQISSYLYINQNAIKTININTATYDELNKHPYIDTYLAKTIVRLREKNGNFSSLEDMQKQTKLYNDLFIKLKPYLITN